MYFDLGVNCLFKSVHILGLHQPKGPKSRSTLEMIKITDSLISSDSSYKVTLSLCSLEQADLNMFHLKCKICFSKILRLVEEVVND